MNEKKTAAAAKVGRFTKFLDAADLFSEPVPGFNVGGRTRVFSFSGVVCTVIAFALVALFTQQKLTVVFTRYNPRINSLESEEATALTEETGLDLGKINFQVAVGLKFNY